MKKNDKNLNSVLLEAVSVRPIAFNPMLGRLVKSAAAGLLMSQLLYWQGKGRDHEWFYKTIGEMQEETCLTRAEQQTAIKKWKALGVLQTKNKDVPRKRYFKVDYDKLSSMLISANKSADADTQLSQKKQTNTETTQKNTSNTDISDFKKRNFKPIPLNDFKPKDKDENRLLEIAKQLEEPNINFILYAYRRKGLSVVERVAGEVREEAIKDPKIRKGALFNSLISKQGNNPMFKV